MAALNCLLPASLASPPLACPKSPPPPPSISLFPFPASPPLSLSFLPLPSLTFRRLSPPHISFVVAESLATPEPSKVMEPLKVMISGAPASGKGTQCQLIVQKYNLVHISAGDLLRAEIAAGSENGRRAKEFMARGELVPNEIVVNMVKDRLSQPDAQEKGWLLDGYPRSLSQAQAIEALGIRPDIFIVLDVPDDILLERVVGRRLDPVTGKIYHLKYSPPENEEIANRLTQRFDDTVPQTKLRLQTHTQNVEAVLTTYDDVIKKIDGNRPKELVFQDIDSLLSSLSKAKLQTASASVCAHGSNA